MSLQAIDIDDFNPAIENSIELEEDSEETLDPDPPEIINNSTTTVEINSIIEKHPKIVVFQLDSKKLDNSNTVTIPIHHTGEWFDWRYDTFTMTRGMLMSMVNNFKKKVVHPNADLNRQVPIQVGHGIFSDPEALGWATKLEVQKQGNEHVIMATFQLSDEGKAALSSSKYAYVSPSYSDNYVEQQIVNGVRKEYGPTLLHVALTNSPVLAELPNIALSKTPLVMDISGIQFQREVNMSQASGTEEPNEEPQVPPTPAAPASPEQQTTTVQATQVPPTQTQSTENTDTVILSRTEFEKVKLDLTNLQSRLENESRRAHQLSVENIVSEAVRRGVPPAVTNIIKPILLVSHPEAQRTIELSNESGGTDSVNTFEAMKALLDQMPTVELGQKTEEIGGEKPGATMTLEQAEKEGRELWAKTGIVPGFREKKG